MLAALIIGYVVVLVFAWALCRAAAEGDRQLEETFEERFGGGADAPV